MPTMRPLVSAVCTPARCALRPRSDVTIALNRPGPCGACAAPPCLPRRAPNPRDEHRRAIMHARAAGQSCEAFQEPAACQRSCMFSKGACTGPKMRLLAFAACAPHSSPGGVARAASPPISSLAATKNCGEVHMQGRTAHCPSLPSTHALALDRALAVLWCTAAAGIANEPMTFALQGAGRLSQARALLYRPCAA